MDVNNDQAMLEFIRNALATKVTANWSDLITNIALKAVKTVVLEDKGRREIDIKRYAKVEKVSEFYHYNFMILSHRLMFDK